MPEWSNKVKHALKAGQVQMGTWMMLPGVHYAATLGKCGFDWVLVDTEHSPMDVRDMSEAVATLDRSASMPFVRVHRGTLEDVKRALDCGAWGVMAPMIMTPEEAAAFVTWCKYPPAGVRSAGVYANDLMGVDSASYVQSANDELLISIQLEHIDAINRLDSILDVPGLDVIFVGPGDLCLSLGIPVMLENTDPKYLAATDRILDACAKRGVPVGIMCGTADDCTRAIGRGYKMISLQFDVAMIPRLFQAELSKVSR